MASKKEGSDNSEDKNIKTLVDNFTSFQKVMTNLTGKIDNLSNQISELLKLFESSAKALAEKDYKKEKEDKASKEDVKKKKEIVEKLDKVLEQNKTIARGLTLMHEKVEEHDDMLSEEGNGPGQGFQGMQASTMQQPSPQPPPQQQGPQPQGQQPAQPSGPPQPQQPPQEKQEPKFQKHYPKGPSTHPDDAESPDYNTQSKRKSSDENDSTYKRIDPSKKAGLEQYSS